MQNHWKSAARDAAKKAGHYDGRFSPKSYMDRSKNHDKYLCRQKVEWVEEESVETPEDDDVAEITAWEEEVIFNPFALALAK